MERRVAKINPYLSNCQSRLSHPLLRHGLSIIHPAHSTNAVMPIILRMVADFFILELYLGGLRAFYDKAFGLHFVVFGGVLGVED